jgi:hypothetical protein
MAGEFAIPAVFPTLPDGEVLGRDATRTSRPGILTTLPQREPGAAMLFVENLLLPIS